MILSGNLKYFKRVSFESQCNYWKYMETIFAQYCYPIKFLKLQIAKGSNNFFRCIKPFSSFLLNNSIFLTALLIIISIKQQNVWKYMVLPSQVGNSHNCKGSNTYSMWYDIILEDEVHFVMRRCPYEIYINQLFHSNKLLQVNKNLQVSVQNSLPKGLTTVLKLE